MLTFDSNILVYALDLDEPVRRLVARNLLGAATGIPAFITQQALGEFCNVALRKRLLAAARIRAQVEAWTILFTVVRTEVAQLPAAAILAEQRRKQFWDMVLVRVAADAGATVLLTEDIGDGETIDGVRIVNPFDPANATLLERLLPAS